jgi:hypothetical protein
LISCTTPRARSLLAQNAASDCCDSSSLSRLRLAPRSKEVSQFDDAAVQLGEAVGEIGHRNSGRSVVARCARR